jgi:hypothetical protein
MNGLICAVKHGYYKLSETFITTRLMLAINPTYRPLGPRLLSYVCMG